MNGISKFIGSSSEGAQKSTAGTMRITGNILKTTIRFGVGLALAAFLTRTANATVTVYNWVPDSAANSAGAPGTIVTSGQLKYDDVTGTFPAFSWDLEGYGYNGRPDTAVNSGMTVLMQGNGDIVLDGTTSSGDPLSPHATWHAAGPFPSVSEQGASEPQSGNYPGSTVWGDWVPVIVPEPSTVMLVGAGLMGMLTVVRRRKTRSN